MDPHDLPTREPDQIRRDCARKLREVEVSDHFQAILGCLLGGGLDHATARRDGHHPGRPPARSMRGRGVVQGVPGASEDLLRNIHSVAPVAELDGDEIGYLVGKVAEIKRRAR